MKGGAAVRRSCSCVAVWKTQFIRSQPLWVTSPSQVRKTYTLAHTLLPLTQRWVLDSNCFSFTDIIQSDSQEMLSLCTMKCGNPLWSFSQFQSSPSCFFFSFTLIIIFNISISDLSAYQQYKIDAVSHETRNIIACIINMNHYLNYRATFQPPFTILTHSNVYYV